MSATKLLQLAAGTAAITVLAAAWTGGLYLLFCCGAATEAPEQIKCIVMNRC